MNVTFTIRHMQAAVIFGLFAFIFSPVAVLGAPVCSVVGIGTPGLGTGTVTPTVHGNTQAGDLLLFYGQTALNTEVSDVDPSGYTLLTNVGTNNGEVWAKIATGSETAASISFNGSSRTAAFIATVRSSTGWPSLAGIVAHSSTGANSSTGIRYRALTITTADTCAIQFGSHNMTTGATNIATSANVTAGFTAMGFAAQAVNSGIVIAAQLQSQTTPVNLAQNTVTVNTNSDSTTSLGASIALVMASAPLVDITVCSSGCNQTTLAAALSAAVPGDIIELRSVPQGTLWNAPFDLDVIGVNGTANNPITIRVRDGDQVRFESSSAVGDAALDVNNSNYVVIAGNTNDKDGLLVGNVNDWSYAGRGFDFVSRISIRVNNSTYIWLKNFTASGARDFYGNQFNRSAHHILVSDCIFDRHGNNNDTLAIGGTNSDAGDLVRMGSRFTRVENCSFSHGGHNVFTGAGSSLVLRNNVFDGEWEDLSTGMPGARAMVLLPSDDGVWDTNTFTSERGPAVMEANIIKNSDDSLESGSAFHNGAQKIHGVRVIARGNYYWDNNGPPWVGAGYSGIGDSVTVQAIGFGRLYQNTSYSSSGTWTNNTSAWNSPNSTLDFQDWKVWNNLLQEVDNNNQQSSTNVVDWRTVQIPLGSFANGWRDGGWKYNVFAGAATDMTIHMRQPGPVNNTVAIENGADTGGNCSGGLWPNNVCGNVLSTVTFVNPAARTKAGFALNAASAVGIDDARPLTTTTDAGTGDTTLTLQDPWWFKDGWTLDFSKIGSYDERADCIAVTPTSTGDLTNALLTRIVNINYSTGAITVSPGVDHGIGSKVWYGGNGSACGPAWGNRGAAQ